MADLAFYNQHFGISSNGELLAYFLEHMKKTNRTADFFVNWRKILARTDNPEYRDALNLLAGVHQVEDPSAELKRLLLNYPRTGDIVADMLAISKDKRKQTLALLRKDGLLHEIPIIFKTQSFSEDNAEILTLFVEQSGLLAHISKIGNLWDYVFGVEVGTDTNARKNRGGNVGEEWLRSHILSAASSKNLRYDLKRKPAQVTGRNVEIPKEVLDREFDGLLFSQTRIIGIEVNFFSVPGTKLDSIASDYQTRARDCREAGLVFAWVTDGQGWRSSEGMLRQAIENIDYVFNFDLLERGALTKLVEHVF